MQKKSQLEGEVNKFTATETEYHDLMTMLELAEEEEDADLVFETEASLKDLEHRV